MEAGTWPLSLRGSYLLNSGLRGPYNDPIPVYIFSPAIQSSDYINRPGVGVVDGLSGAFS